MVEMKRMKFAAKGARPRGVLKYEDSGKPVAYVTDGEDPSLCQLYTVSWGWSGETADPSEMEYQEFVCFTPWANDEGQWLIVTEDAKRNVLEVTVPSEVYPVDKDTVAVSFQDPFDKWGGDSVYYIKCDYEIHDDTLVVYGTCNDFDGSEVF